MLNKPENILQMRKLALLGKNIQHSKSPEIYKDLISPAIQYDLLDYKNVRDIPTAKELMDLYEGINITSPYKKVFLNDVILNPSAKNTGAINCLRKIGDKIFAENTDYKAIVDILNSFKETEGELVVAILGDGVMSEVTQVALTQLSIPWEVFSRKKTSDFTQLNLEEIYKKKEPTLLTINTCAREFVFKGELPRESIFWDYNYSFVAHSSTIPSKVRQYHDGLSLLFKQAEYTVAFWSGKN
jgi:shikimate dehydrogenase